MSLHEVPTPILNSPYEEPRLYWYIQEGEETEKRSGRRPPLIFPPRDRKEQWDRSDGTLAECVSYPTAYELSLVSAIRTELKRWREQSYPGVTRPTLELLQWWNRDGRRTPLFFAQREAAETIIFLTEARSDFLQGIIVPREGVGEEKMTQGYSDFLRYACKMATGSGKTVVMGMLCAWSILNKLNGRSDKRFSDTVLVVCPNVTIRNRLQELDPERGEASVYVQRDLVPPHLRSDLTQGRVIVTNWHDFLPQSPQIGGVSAKVVKTGVPQRKMETITIGEKNTTARGRRYLTLETYNQLKTSGVLTVIAERHDDNGIIVSAKVESTRYIESDSRLVDRVLGSEAAGKGNILVLNDEAHHAYRIRKDEEEGDDELADEEDADEFYKEATIWVDGLDKVHKVRGINVCIDLSATPYFLGRMGKNSGRSFPWIVSDFGLVDAIESGLTAIPQLVARDSTGAEVPSYFNLWQWILEKLTPKERGGRRASPKPEAILKYASLPITMLGSYWQQDFAAAQKSTDDPRPPVFIVVCKNTSIAKVVYEWIAEGKSPSGIEQCRIPEWHNSPEQTVTIRVDSKVVSEIEELEGSKADEKLWMRFTLDTVGKMYWPVDTQGRPVYPQGFKELAEKLKRPLTPPGKDVQCIVSVGMLTEGWDCNTVSHIVGLRPFMSQLLCEQVVGRGLRRRDYELDESKDPPIFREEVVRVFGVPFEIIPYKTTKIGPTAPPPKRHHVHSMPAKAAYTIHFPRVEGYTWAVKNRITVDWDRVPELLLEPGKIPPEVQMKAGLPNNKGKLSLFGPGKAETLTLEDFRRKKRVQELVYELASSLTRDIVQGGASTVPVHVLFPQLREIVGRYIAEKVHAEPPADIRDAFLSPYYGWLIERLQQAIRPDTAQGETPELPIYEANRGPGSTADVDQWTGKDIREVLHSHVNYVVADTKQWEQSAAFLIDTHLKVEAFVKNYGLGFAIPYTWNGAPHDYLPDFIIRLKDESERYLILETKGYDEREQVKVDAARRWVAAVNADRKFGQWSYKIAKKVSDVRRLIDEANNEFLASSQ